jgi:hypothetical protein
MQTPSAVLKEIESLDPERDYARISYLSICYDFPWDVTHALDLALLKGSCVPSISGLQAETGEFVHRTQKRYDTLLILAELLESGYDSERRRAAQRQMNRPRHRFPIANEGYPLTALVVTVNVPVRFADASARMGLVPATLLFGWELGFA